MQYYPDLRQQDSPTDSMVFKSQSYRPHIPSKFHTVDEYILKSGRFYLGPMTFYHNNLLFGLAGLAQWLNINP